MTDWQYRDYQNVTPERSEDKYEFEGSSTFEMDEATDIPTTPNGTVDLAALGISGLMFIISLGLLVWYAVIASEQKSVDIKLVDQKNQTIFRKSEKLRQIS